jgi:flagellar basal-body rod protein FlgB
MVITHSAIEFPAVQLLGLALDAASLRQQVIANNIANAGIPDFQPLRVSFEERLSALAASNRALAPDGLRQLRPTISADSGATPAIDQQMVQLSANVLHYRALLKNLNAHFELLSLASNDGRR